MAPPERNPPDPSLDNTHETRPGTTTSAPRRNATRGSPARTPTGTPAALAQQPAANAAARSPAGTPIAESATAATGSPVGARPDALAGFGAGAPYAAAALGALASMAAQYGNTNPTADTGQPYAPPALGGGQPTSWPGESGTQYAANNLDTARRGQSTQSLNAELGRLLGGAADSTIRGRAAIDGIIAEVNTAMTALGGVADTTAGRQMLITTLSNALQRAGTVLGQGQTAAAITADKVAALADRFLQNARPTRQPQRRAQPSTSGSSARPPRTRPSGRQGQWINDALRILAANGYDTRYINPADIAAIIQHESAGDPNAINLWDSNAAKGTPSKGLMQTIDPTFNAYALPGHRDIWNPVDNIIAGVRYAIARYGSVSNVPGIQAMHQGGHYVGY
ncbi:transglycosylase SLT domain-containing protein [Nocardia anaemiae]|uniref:transglycosylase SLT domain-containing protein n=1 Tax=Nocardia anaemiae TaxID=263910 RepID=UPI000A00E77A|nr:transglycosylase SLT domain-containing protein [Nocardia anaemiae]